METRAPALAGIATYGGERVTLAGGLHRISNRAWQATEFRHLRMAAGQRSITFIRLKLE